MAANATVKVFFVGDAKQLQGVMADVGRDATATGEHAKKAGAGFSTLQTALIGLGVGAGLKKVIGDASDLNETVSKSNTIFKSAAGEIEAWAGGAARSIGLSKQEALSAAATFGNMFDQLGIGSEQAAKMSTSMVDLAADFASFHNANTVDVLDAMTAGFRGEYDALQRFVPTINAAAVEQKALEMGLAATTKELDAQDKALAVQALVMGNAGEAAGDFARTSDSLANKQRIMQAELKNVSAELGGHLLPIATQVVGALTKVLDVFSSLPGPMQGVILGAAGVAGGLVVAGKAADAFKTAKESIEGVVGALKKVGQHSDEAAASATSLGSSLGKLAGPTIGILGLAAAIAVFAQDMKAPKRDIDETAAALASMTEINLVGWVSEFGEKMDLFRQVAESNIDSATRWRDEIARTGGDVSAYNAILEDVIGSQIRMKESTERSADTLAVGAVRSKEYAAASKEIDERLKDSVITIEKYTGAITGGQKSAMDAAEAQGDFAEAISDLSQAVKENGTSLDVWTTKGRAVRGALDELIVKGGEWLDAIYKQYGAGKQWADAHVEMRNQIILSMRQLGFGVDAINQYINTWLASVRQMAYVVDGWKTYGDELDRYEGRLTDSIEEKWGALPEFFKTNSVKTMDEWLAGVATKSPGVIKSLGDAGSAGGAALADGVKDGVKDATDALDILMLSTIDWANAVKATIADAFKTGTKGGYSAVVEQVSAGLPTGGYLNDNLRSFNTALGRLYGLRDNGTITAADLPALVNELMRKFGVRSGPSGYEPDVGGGGTDTGGGGGGPGQGPGAEPTIETGGGQGGTVNVTVNVNSPVVQNPVTANSLAYSISRQAAVAFAGAA